MGSKISRNYVLLIGCEDQKGLVHQITGILYKAGLNIVRNAEFVDIENQRFYMRTEFECPIDSKDLQNQLKEIVPQNAWLQLIAPKRKNVIVMATREHHCLGDLLLRNAHDDLNANITAIISNHPTLEDLTTKFGIPFHHIGHDGLSRCQHEQQIISVMNGYSADYIVLAKYMRILSPEFVSLFSQRLINIHHSFLPAFVGANPYRQAYERGVKIIGATAHFVTNDLDEGPIIVQSVLPIDHQKSIREIARAGREVEKAALARALDLVFSDQVIVVGNRTIVFE